MIFHLRTSVRLASPGQAFDIGWLMLASIDVYLNQLLEELKEFRVFRCVE